MTPCIRFQQLFKSCQEVFATTAVGMALPLVWLLAQAKDSVAASHIIVNAD